MAVKKSILKVSQLPELKNAEWNGIKTITAYDKKNYLLDVKEIKARCLMFDCGLIEPAGLQIISSSNSFYAHTSNISCRRRVR